MEIKANSIEAKLFSNEQVNPIVLRIKLTGASQLPQIEGLQELPGKANYFRGNDPSKWYTTISTFSKIKYHDVYPGIDIVYYGNQGQLEHDYVISPGADPKLITLDIEGINKLDVDENGDLVLESGNDQLPYKETSTGYFGWF